MSESGGEQKGSVCMVGKIKDWEGSGKLCENQKFLCVWTVIFSFLLPALSLLPNTPSVERLLVPIGLLSPSSHTTAF